MVNGWKVTAIIFITLLGLHLAFDIWMVNLVMEDEEKTNTCYYDICEGYADYWYGDDVCYCYEYDILGSLQVEKTEYMK